MPKLIFINSDGSRKIVDAPTGVSILDVTRKFDIDLEGACEGSLACSTCHVYIDEKFFSSLPPAAPEEEDMLDLAFALKSNSRLGCQIMITDEFEGMEVTLPDATRNL